MANAQAATAILHHFPMLEDLSQAWKAVDRQTPRREPARLAHRHTHQARQVPIRVSDRRADALAVNELPATASSA
jgi:hypothetical protein